MRGFGCFCVDDPHAIFISVHAHGFGEFLSVCLIIRVIEDLRRLIYVSIVDHAL